MTMCKIQNYASLQGKDLRKFGNTPELIRREGIFHFHKYSLVSVSLEKGRGDVTPSA